MLLLTKYIDETVTAIPFTTSVPSHSTIMYPMPLMCLLPLSGENIASFPHELELFGYPPVPNPIRESQLEQSLPLLLMMPILALEAPALVLTALKPSLLQLSCNEA